MIGNDADLEPWPGEAGLTDAQAMWRERERRQRSVRFLMMFLLMLLLMDGEEQSQRRRSHDHNLRKRSKSSKGQQLDKYVYASRRQQDAGLEKSLKEHPRYRRLVDRNSGRDVDAEIRNWAEQQLDLQKDEFAQDEADHVDPEEETVDLRDDLGRRFPGVVE